MSTEQNDRNWDDILEKIGPLDPLFQYPPAKTAKLYLHYLNPILVQIVRFIGTNVHFVHAKGAYLKDEKGRDYLDFLSGFGALNLGHEPDEVIDILRRVENRANLFQSSMNPFSGKLGELLAAVTPGDLSRSFFCSSGAEAVEAALKLARISTGRKVLLSTKGAYHGKTYGALSVSGKEKYRTPFAPLLPDTESIPYNDLEALQLRLSLQDVAGFIVEPIQGENGVVVPTQGYLNGAEALCRRYQTLLIVDEIQTGMGRTGKLFCCDHEGVTPDVLVLSKSLGGGVMPIGAVVTRNEIWKRAYGSLDTGLLHSTTFGGNLRASACALAAVKTLIEKRLPERAEKMGEVLQARLQALKKNSSLLKEVRGKGLMIGLQFARLKGKARLAEGALTLWIARQLAKKHRIITAFTLNNLDVLRIAPPLIISEKEIDRFVISFESVLQSAQTFEKLRLVKK